jgi:hypothetical protein
MEVIAKVECFDCGPSIVVEPDNITVFMLQEEFYGMAICQFCLRPIYVPVNIEFTIKVKRKGVKVISWTAGEISLEELEALDN